ncbi:hypothetical protein YC2023_081579 [Brassica napus]
MGQIHNIFRVQLFDKIVRVFYSPLCGPNIFKTGPEAEPDNYWVTFQHGSTRSNILAGPKRGFHNPLVELFIVASAPSGGIKDVSLWFLNQRTIMDVMLISSCNLYPFVDESHFVEREYYEVYPEIYGDPIYDTYEDDVYVIDFVFKENSFENPRHGKFTSEKQNQMKHERKSKLKSHETAIHYSSHRNERPRTTVSDNKGKRKKKNSIYHLRVRTIIDKTKA